MEKHIKILYALVIVGFLSLMAQLWIQAQTLNNLKIKIDSISELLFRLV
jgi:hypothetical protein